MGRTKVTPTAGRASRRSQRGVAVLLALIAVAIAILIGLAVSSTRDATTVTSDQIVRLSQSRLAGKTSVDIADFVVRSHTNILDSTGIEVERVVYADKRIGNSIYSASIQDATTELSPTRSTVAIKIRAMAREIRPSGTTPSSPTGTPTESPTETATSMPTDSAIIQTVNAMVRVPWPDVVARADIDLSEFALLASTAQAFPTIKPKIEIGANAEVSVWRDAPLAVLGDPIVIGAVTRDPKQVSLSASTRLNGVQILAVGPFAQSSIEAEEQLADGIRTLPEDIHVPRLAVATGLSYLYAGNTDTPSPYTGLNNLTPWPHKTLRPPPGGRFTSVPLTFEGPIQPGQWRMVRIRGLSVQLVDCRWRFEVPTMLVIEGKLELLNGTRFEIGPRGALTIVALDGVMVSGSYIGPALDPSGTWSTTGAQPYGGLGASRVMILEGGNPMGTRFLYQTAFMDSFNDQATGSRRDIPGGTNPTILKDGTKILNGGAVVGEIYAPDSAVLIGFGCALYGRALAHQITVCPGGRVFYDPQLDTGAGWLNPQSGIWGGSGSARSEVRDIGLLTDEFLSRFSTSTALAVGPIGNGMLMTANVRDGGFMKVDMEKIQREEVNGSGITSGQPGPIQGTTTPVGVPSVDYVFPAQLTLYGIIRDFRGRSFMLGHPDFGLEANAARQWWAIGSRLDADGKPAVTKLAGSVGASRRAIASESSFMTWFRDTAGQNVALPRSLAVGRVQSFGHTAADPRWVYNVTGGSLGVDRNDGYGDNFDPWPSVGSMTANSSFTVELGCSFVYRQDKGQWLYIKSSNDVLVYLDGQLLIDIGGQSQPTARSIDLNSIAAKFGLIDKQTYRLRFFVASRYAVVPTDFNLWFNFPFIEDPVPDLVAFPRLEEIKRVRDEVAAKFRADDYQPLEASIVLKRPRILGFTTGIGSPSTGDAN
ncbi:MAG: hypothetical protein RLY21_575 [Planctomycetota bacterium]